MITTMFSHLAGSQKLRFVILSSIKDIPFTRLMYQNLKIRWCCLVTRWWQLVDF